MKESQSQNTVHFGKEDYEAICDRAERNGFDSPDEYLAFLDRYYGEIVSKPTPLNARASSEADSPECVFETKLGQIWRGDSSDLMANHVEPESIDLVMTSPPFGLVRQKSYGNEDADRYLRWFRPFADGLQRILKPSGSLVIDIGGAWKKGRPVRSLYHFELLVMLCREYGFHLIQEFFWWNPAKLPSPAEWVNIRRIRVKDAVNCIWWLAKTPYPKATNRRVLQPYSQSMSHLLKHGYKAKKRPSGWDISRNFSKDNVGAIPPNLIALANTESNSAYQRYCKQNNLVEHPARFPLGLPALFIRMVTDEEDVVFDPFAGSCVTGEAAERMHRQWVCCELDAAYVEGARGRFVAEELAKSKDLVGRLEPYEAHPPSLGLLDEASSPLAEDGGKRRPGKETQGDTASDK
jgi:site-specific DNA-methyltransferase (cytosine-N4-specific)